MDHSDMTSAMLVGSAVLILTQVAIVLVAIWWQKRRQARQNRP